MRRARIGSLVLVVTCCTVVLAACHDTPSEPADTPFQARINSQPFVATFTDFSISNAGNRLLISGVRTAAGGGGRQVSVQLESWHGPGSYALGDPSGGALGFILDLDTAHVSAGTWATTSQATGLVTVTSLDQAGRQIRGTFYFQAQDSTGGLLTVSDGTFSGHYFVDP